MLSRGLELILFYCFSRVHFIPLSASYNEIYNIIAYFSGPTPSTLISASLDDLSTLNSASSNSSSPLTSSDSSPSSSTTNTESKQRNVSKLSDYALEALQNQEVLMLTKHGREVLRSVDAERRLRRIARAGKEWKRTMGRKVDMEGVCFLSCVRRSCFFFLFLSGCAIVLVTFCFALSFDSFYLWSSDRLTLFE
jgi:hypothetical protein